MNNNAARVIIMREAIKLERDDAIAQGKLSVADYIELKDAYSCAVDALNDINRIKTIVERALRSSDPINSYKAKSLDEIAAILGVKIEDPADTGLDKEQITIDDII